MEKLLIAEWLICLTICVTPRRLNAVTERRIGRRTVDKAVFLSDATDATLFSPCSFFSF